VAVGHLYDASLEVVCLLGLEGAEPAAPASPAQAAAASDEPGRPDHAGGYLPWAVVPQACVDSCSPDFPGRVRGWAGSLPSLLPYRAARTT
jgi:hypothetical protein